MAEPLSLQNLPRFAPALIRTVLIHTCVGLVLPSRSDLLNLPLLHHTRTHTHTAGRCVDTPAQPPLRSALHTWWLRLWRPSRPHPLSPPGLFVYEPSALTRHHHHHHLALLCTALLARSHSLSRPQRAHSPSAGAGPCPPLVGVRKTTSCTLSPAQFESTYRKALNSRSPSSPTAPRFRPPVCRTDCHHKPIPPSPSPHPPPTAFFVCRTPTRAGPQSKELGAVVCVRITPPPRSLPPHQPSIGLPCCTKNLHLPCPAPFSPCLHPHHRSSPPPLLLPSLPSYALTFLKKTPPFPFFCFAPLSKRLRFRSRERAATSFAALFQPPL